MRPVVIPDLFETLVWAIIGQQINVQFAAKCKRALVERFGPRFEVDGQVYLLFPTAELLANAREADLAALQFSRQKIRYTLNLARDIALRLVTRQQRVSACYSQAPYTVIFVPAQRLVDCLPISLKGTGRCDG